MSEIYLVGVGMTRFGKFLDRSVKSLTREAVTLALDDAGAQVADIGAAFFANAVQSPLEGQHMVAGQIALRDMGFERLPIVNVENACASASTAVNLAWAHLSAGLCDVALAVGAEKMYSTDKARMFSVFDGAWDVHDVAKIEANLGLMAGEAAAPAPVAGGSRSVFMDLYASMAKFHMREHGTTQRHIAAVSAKNHRHSAFNPLSQYQQSMTTDEVLAAREIVWPLTLPMCAPVSDGAAAAILVRKEALDRFDRKRAIKVMSTVVASGSSRRADESDKHICRLAAAKAYEMAGIGPTDISVAEVHDATAFAEIVQSENLGFCEPGQGGWLADRGDTALGGRLPINPSGGLESKGHPIGATGLAQIYELVTQLRHEARDRQVEGARFAVAENGGGFYGFEEAAACITILGR
jgi:acetyl-CoA acyltransferase